MPELPEVESVRLSLLPEVVGRVITGIEILTDGVFLNENLPVTGWRIDDIRRRGKYLIFDLSRPQEQARLIVHLRMTGQLLLQQEKQPPAKHTHVLIQLECSETDCLEPAKPIWLAYHDTRRFGRLWLLPVDSHDVPGGLARLGLEPLDPDFSPEKLRSLLAKRPNSKLKAILLDQSIIAGLGNIYADEVLFASKLHPARIAASLSEAEIAGLANATVQVLSRAIACQGTTLRDYVNGWNQKGTFQNCLMVYSRAGQPCRQCGSPIASCKLAGRTTCWCPVCQPELNHL